jgi:radical SAM protein with 4Fe4S-binding SPASM domain
MTLCREDGETVLYRRTWTGSFPKFPVHPVSAVLLALLDGERTTDQVANILAEVFSFSEESSQRLVDLVLRKYERFLVDPAKLNGKGPPVAYDPAEFLTASKPIEHFQRETVPQYIWWRVTRHCNRRCKYCCVGAKWAPQAPDCDISFERLQEIFHEGADIGVRGVSLGGGEPFIRPDLVEVIELLLDLDYEVDMNTKFALGEEQVRRLATAGLSTIDVSFDTAEKETANYLVGDKDYFDGITATMRSLVRHGIDLHVTAVLTERNVRELPGLVSWLADTGASQLTLNTFSRYYGRCRYVPKFELSAENRSWLAETIPALAEEYRDSMHFIYDRFFNLKRAEGESELPEGDSQADSSPCHSPERTLNCDQGIRILRMLPDGRVSRCDQWGYEEEVVFGDLKTQSIWEVWSSPKLTEMIYPQRELFAGSECASCGLFDDCNHTGRCIWAAQEAHGTIYAPDNHCLRRAQA